MKTFKKVTMKTFIMLRKICVEKKKSCQMIDVRYLLELFGDGPILEPLRPIGVFILQKS